MLTKRLIACLDVVGENVTKAVKFEDNISVGNAAEISARLYEAGIDEIIFYDILASAEKRKINIDVVKQVAKNVFVPFTVGGGLRHLRDMEEALKAGAEKISIDSMAVRNPQIIQDGARAFGSQCIVLSTQVKKVERSAKIPSGYEVAIDGARVFTGMDVIEWVRKAEDLGAGEVCVNSIDRDGTLSGYDIELLASVAATVNIPIIASGGAGVPLHIVELFKELDASAAIISSMLYSPRMPRNFTMSEVKNSLTDAGIAVRPLSY